MIAFILCQFAWKLISTFRLWIPKARWIDTASRSYVDILLTQIGMTQCVVGMSIIDKFHEDPEAFIFLISILSGGTGLNLTGANKVVIFGAPNNNLFHNFLNWSARSSRS